MTWSRFDDAAALGPKANAAGNEAWSLWTAAVMYSNRHLTDGFLTINALATKCLPVPIPVRKAEALARKLCEAIANPDGCGLFEAVEGGYQIHDFLEWNPSKAEVEERRRSDRNRKKPPPDSGGNPKGSPGGFPKTSNRNPNGVPPASETPRASARAPAPASQPGHSQPGPSGGEEEDHPPRNSPPASGERPRDRMAEHFNRQSAKQRGDVRELHAAWKEKFGLMGHEFIGSNLIDADVLAECIDAHGLDTCLLVLEFAPDDRMVSGKDDETGMRHESIAYIFGNQTAFARILRAATVAKTSGESVEDRFNRLRNEVAS